MLDGKRGRSMTHPTRLQRSRRKGAKLESPNGLPVRCVDRSTKFGNPFKPGKIGPMGRSPIDKLGSLGCFLDMLRDPQLRAAAGFPSNEEIKQELGGKNLACYCGPREECHADELLKIASGGSHQ
jgi:hypothetical protein